MWGVMRQQGPSPRVVVGARGCQRSQRRWRVMSGCERRTAGVQLFRVLLAVRVKHVG